MLTHLRGGLLNSITILCVDEYELMLLTMQHMLEHEGWQVDAFRDGTQAMERLESGYSYDAIIINEKLPGISGLEILERMRRLSHCRQTPVIMFTSMGGEVRARRLGVDALLQKPNDIRHLTAVVARCLHTTLNNDRDPPPPSRLRSKHSTTILRFARPRATGKGSLFKSLKGVTWSIHAEKLSRASSATNFDHS